MGLVLLQEETQLNAFSAMWNYSKQVAIVNKKRVPTRTQPWGQGTPILDFQPVECWEINICSVSHPAYGILL